jgi:glycine cleavage system H protein
VLKVNGILIDQPELVNGEPYEGGWIVEVEVEGSVEEAFGKLLSAEGYKAITE